MLADAQEKVAGGSGEARETWPRSLLRNPTSQNAGKQISLRIARLVHRPEFGHSERSEESRLPAREILRCAQDDGFETASSNLRFQ